jgi:Fic family protein
MSRRYQQTHPWITFRYDPAFEQVSMRVGEAFSKCQHLAGTPLQPDIARDLASVYLVKGAVATTAIEGNTLSEQEAADILAGRRTLPASQQYLEQEVRNVVAVLEGIDRASWSGQSWRLTPDWLADQNRAILRDLAVAEHVVPGVYTTSALVVGNYRGAPPEDVPYLMERLCEWINTMIEQGQAPGVPREMAFFNLTTTAVLAHLYLVWIHPFGDGNGRTARAVECAILATSGMVPWVASNLMSDHYNRTRSHYYERLAGASGRADVRGFVRYALDGFVDLLREQIHTVQSMQRRVAWQNYVHERFRQETDGEASKRRRDLLLALPVEQRTPRNQLSRLTPDLAAAYATRSPKTISHDVNRLASLGLIRGDSRSGYQPRIDLMDAFLPAHNHPEA